MEMQSEKAFTSLVEPVFVVRRDDVAIKLPLKYEMTSLDEAQVEFLKAPAANSSDSIQREMKVHRRLGPIDGIVPFLDDDQSGVGWLSCRMYPKPTSRGKIGMSERHS